MTELKKTPLYEAYGEYGGKTIDFGGWALPVQFSSIKQEHEAVRTKAGLFDVSHMGEIMVKGSDSTHYLQKMMTNDLSKLHVGGAQYTAMCYEDGGVVDDLLVYKLAEDDYLLVVNAANTKSDLDWLNKHVCGDVLITNVSEDIAQLAIQGPLAEEILQQFTEEDLSTIGFFKFKANTLLFGKEVLLSRTGYTGEDGFEIYCRNVDVLHIWNGILQSGVTPCGLGARDTLRFEAGLVLYGQEISAGISPLEAGIGFAVKLGKNADFIGKEALTKQKQNGIPRKLIGLEMIGRGIPRHGYAVYSEGREIGHITTGTQSPTLGKNIGLALIDSQKHQADGHVVVHIRGKEVEAKEIPIPFYKKGQ